MSTKTPLADSGNTITLSRIPQPFSATKDNLKREILTGNNANNAINQMKETKRIKLEERENIAPLPISKQPKGKNMRRSVSMGNLNLRAFKKPITTGKTAAAPKPIRTAAPIPKPSMGRPQMARATMSRPTTSNVSVPVNKTGKRPAWDLKGRLLDLEEQMSSIKTEKQFWKGQAESSCIEKDQLLNTVKDTETIKFEQELLLKTTQESLRIKLQRVAGLETELQNLQNEKDTLDLEATNLKLRNSNLTTKSNSLETELTSITSKLEAMVKKCESQGFEIERLEKENLEMTETIASQSEELLNGETLRRQLHNMVQDLKGNIRVFCRVRPLFPAESEFGTGCISFPDPDHKRVTVSLGRRDSNLNESTASSVASQTSTKPLAVNEFAFDHVFTPESSQSEVFGEISQLVQSVLDGYNVCIFAYGPTGSGKTYTMEGKNSDYDESNFHVGMIPRAVEQVFTSADQLESKGWKYEMEANFIEIYNETIRDLLCLKSDKKHEIKFTKDKEVFVSNITNVKVSTSEQVFDLIRQANKSRAVAATKCNERSSRSHSVFSLRLQGRNEILQQTCKGILNLVDLAGSERVKMSCSEGERLREAQNINKSLSNLGNVITSLAQKAEHIPYRNSKLTFLLSNCLGGNSKTLMFINISPSEEHYQESLNSLRFAKTVNECYVGVAQKRK